MRFSRNFRAFFWQLGKSPNLGYYLAMDEWVMKLRAWAGQWPAQAVPYFVSTWGLNKAFAAKVALLYLACWAAGLNPRVTSGFRDPKKQAAMRAAWDRGDRVGLVVRPADPKTSKHCSTTMTGAPNSLAVDMQCTDNELAARIGKALGLRAGLYFTNPDPGHFDEG